MANFVHCRDPYLYSWENLLDDTDWAFLFSYSYQPPLAELNPDENEFPQMRKDRAKVLAKIKESKLETIERFEKYFFSILLL